MLLFVASILQAAEHRDNNTIEKDWSLLKQADPVLYNFGKEEKISLARTIEIGEFEKNYDINIPRSQIPSFDPGADFYPHSAWKKTHPDTYRLGMLKFLKATFDSVESEQKK